MQVELTKDDITNLLLIINTSSFKGDSAEQISALKKKLAETQKDDAN